MFCFKKKEKYKLKLWYGVQNGGGGSASINFFESKELGEFYEDHVDDEGFCESVSYIECESDSPITCKEDVNTIATVREELNERLEYVPDCKWTLSSLNKLKELEEKLNV
jgi:hypothetical protein